MPAQEQSELIGLFNTWAPLIQGEDNRAVAESLAKARGGDAFVATLRSAVGFFKAIPREEEPSIADIAKTGMGVLYQRSFDRHKSYINAMVASRQMVMEATDPAQQLDLIRNLMHQEITLRR